MLGKIAVGLGAKALVGAVGSAVSGAYGAVSKTGQALGAAGKAIGEAVNSDSTQDTKPSNVITGNFGMAGSAGRQRITGGGTLPAPKTAAKPQVSAKMPTKDLLDTVIKYLSSIDKTLKSQIEFDRRAMQEQTQVEREAIIESKPSVAFSSIKDRLSGLKSDVKDNASIIAKVAKFALILGGTAALIASSLDQKQLDALKENVNQFKKSFGWLGELGAAVGAGGLLGFLFGGKGVTGRLKGGLVGMVAAHVIQRLYSSFSGGNKTDENGNIILDENGKPIKESRSMSGIGYGLSAIAGGIAIRSIAKRLPAAKLAAQTTGQLSRAAGASSVVGIQAATRKGTSWLASRRGRKFLVILGRKLGKGLLAKIGKYLARIVAGLLLTATGVGAIPGILVILGSIAFIGWDILDIATSIYDAFTESAAEDTTAVAVPVVKETDATKVSGTTSGSNAITAVSKSETGRPEEAQAFFQSKGWTKEQAAGIVGNLVVESRLKTDAVGDGGQAYGIAQWHPPRQAKFKEVYGKDIRNSSFQEQLEFVNWELNNSEKAAGNALRKATTASEAATIVDKKYERSAGLHTAERVSNANAVMAGDYGKLSTGGASGYSSTSTSDSMGETAGKVMSNSIASVGKVIGAIGSSVIKPGVARSFAPMVSNTPEKINNESMKVQNDITFGIKKEKSKDLIKAPSTPNGVSITKPVKSFSNMDPNYSKLDVLTVYLGHFRLAA
jgi:hypothetical protein